MSELRFMAVDDSPTMRRIISNTLKKLGYDNVVEAADGKEALDKLHAEKIDFIITDWNMPKMDGLELVKAVKSDPSLKDIPILMVTTVGVKEDIISAVKAGVSNYVVKPFTPQTLKEKIDQILSST